MFQRCDQKLVVFSFYGHFHELLPKNIGVSWRFTMTVRPDTCLRVLTKNSSFSRFTTVFMSYCPRFCRSRETNNDRKARYMFQSYEQKLIVFMSDDIFMRY